MHGNGFFVDDNGILYNDHTTSYDSYEYYRGKLEEKEQLLHYVSLFMQGESSGIRLPELLTMQCRLMLEHMLGKGLTIDSHGCYIPEKLKAENRTLWI
jgi:hypothetical protein